MNSSRLVQTRKKASEKLRFRFRFIARPPNELSLRYREWSEKLPGSDGQTPRGQTLWQEDATKRSLKALASLLHLRSNLCLARSSSVTASTGSVWISMSD